MKSLFNLITLAAICTVAATMLFTSLAAAAGYETRMPLTKDEVIANPRWNDLAEAVVGKRPFTANAELEETSLPTPVVGKMFGGAWGEGGGYEFMRLGTASWTLFQLKKEVPGVMVTVDSGVFLHAELGDGGTAFLFLGMTTSSPTSAGDTAEELNKLLDTRKGDFWVKFEKAVAETTAVKNLQSADIALATRVENLERKAGVSVDGGAGTSPQPRPAAGKGKDGKPGDKIPPSSGDTIATWVIVGVAVIALILFGKRIWRGLEKLVEPPATESPDPPEPPEEEATIDLGDGAREFDEGRLLPNEDET